MSEVRKHATQIVKKLQAAGHTAYFAGGWVRDYLLKHPSQDIDIATDAPPEQILDLFPHTLLIGLAFGIVVVIIEGHSFEVATFRQDLHYADGRRPTEIKLATPQEDARRRDFTINGMFYDPIDEVIYDFVGGTQDLQKGIIRTIGSPDARFTEDRLRMIRAIRFACRFDFTIEPETTEAIIENASCLFPAVAMERIWHELTKMSQTQHFDKAIIEMHRLHLLQEIFPPLQTVHLHDIKHLASSFSHFPAHSPTILYLLTLFPSLSQGALLETFQNLRLSNKELSYVPYMSLCRELVENELLTDPVAWAHFYADPRAELVYTAHAASLPKEERTSLLQRHRERQALLASHIERIAQKNPLITAQCLKSYGFREGRALGQLLKEAERLAITQDLHQPDTVLSELKKLPTWNPT